MRILQINHTYQNGGSTGRITKALSTVMLKHGITPFVAYGYNTDNTDDDGTLCLQGFWRRKWNILRCRIGARHGFYNETETNRLIAFIQEVKPDIIHLHNIHGHYVHVDRLMAYIKQHHIPVVWTLHDCWSFTGWCASGPAHCNKWQTHCDDCKMGREYPYCWFSTHASSNFDKKKSAFTGIEDLTIVTPSSWLSTLVKQSFLKDYPVRVINNGIDLQLFKPASSNIRQQLGIGQQKIILACMGQFIKRKGSEDLEILTKMLADDELLIIVGVPAHQQRLLFLQHCLGLPHTDSIDQLAELYSEASVFINPTYEDNFPTTNIEALACGTPVVTYDTGGSIEAIDQQTGAVVPQGDVKSMLTEARRLINSDQQRLTQLCRARAADLFDMNKQFEQYIDLYSQIMNRHEQS